jgi:hypothetical protein
MKRATPTRIGLVLVAAATWLATIATPAMALEEFDKYAVESASSSLTSTQAGAHADLSIDFSLTQKDGEPHGLTRDIFVHLPPGMIGNPQGIQRCSLVQFGDAAVESECPVSAQVGASEVTLGGLTPETFIEPIYNLTPPGGGGGGGDVVARFGLFAGPYPVLINIRVNPADYSLTAAIEGAAAAASLIGAESTFWGVPAAQGHDPLRLTPKEALSHETPAGGREAGVPESPFLTNPTDCSSSREISVTAVSYQLPSEPKSKSAPFPQITGCGLVGFEAALSVTPTSGEAASPTGLNATLKLPQSEAPNTLGTSTLKSALVTLPEGLTINPAAGDGLGACSDQQVGYGNAAAPACPDDSKLGTAEIEVPALERTLQGAIYQRTPEPGRLFGFWLVTDEQGVRLKLPAEIQADPVTGRLSTVFAGVPALGGLPQVPFGEFRLHFFGGPRAPLSTPSTCGTYQTGYSFTPWSGKPAAVGQAPMQISSGCGKGGFAPRLQAGTTNSFAGSYSPFTFTLTRQDGEANLRDLEVHLPEGLLARLGGVPLCPEASAASGACPPASQIGSVKAASGVGGAPLWIPQPGKAPTAVYLAGPYKGAPYSLIAVVPAQAGPFDLGTVVDRSAIYVDPVTAEATVKSDPLPQILEGVPIAYRAINVTVDHPEFTLNPTNCEAKTISAPLTASNGATADPSTGFEATNCAKLAFGPKLKIQLNGATRRIGHPALRAVLTMKPGEANIARAQVNLPHGEFLDQGNLNKTCTRPVLLAGNCPKSTVYGRAKAWTPLLGRPLEGNVYLVGGYGYKLPALVADLNGQVRVTLIGKVDSGKNKGIRNTFELVPDAPVSRFELRMKGGKRYGLLENSEDLCKASKADRRAIVRFSGQNGKVDAFKPVVANQCKKRHKKKSAGHGKAGAKAHHPKAGGKG